MLANILHITELPRKLYFALTIVPQKQIVTMHMYCAFLFVCLFFKCLATWESFLASQTVDFHVEEDSEDRP